jgi:aminoglycoside phosphotransferase
LVNNISWDADYTNFPDLAELIAFYQQAENEIVLTHGDLSSLNKLICGDDVVGIIDWETAGWFPVYWEYTTAKFVNPMNPFWADPVNQFITPMPKSGR